MNYGAENHPSCAIVSDRPRLFVACCVLWSAVLCAMSSPALASVLPAGFSESPVAAGLSSPTAMQVAPDGRLFICEQDGQVRVVRDGVLLPTPFVTLPVHAAGEQGLLGIALDPAFDSNGFVYVYYTAVSPAIHDRVSRLTANGDVAASGSEIVILDLDPAGVTSRNGGALRFGPDGALYIGVGDHGRGSRAQSPATGHGKVLRIYPDGAIPADNPRLSAGTSEQRAIWASGLRSPSAINVHARTGTTLINDAGSGWNEINEAVPGANYGWPLTEGRRARSASLAGPRYSYEVDRAGGRACGLTGGAFYDPDLMAFPSEYYDTYFFADSCDGSIRRLNLADGTVETFATGLTGPGDLQVSRDGVLYYLVRGSGGLGGVVYRIGFGEMAPSGLESTSARTVTSSAGALSTADTTRIVVSTIDQFRAALNSARPGTVIALNPGVYSGGTFKANLTGTAAEPIVIEAADPANRPIIRGGGNGLQLSDPAYVTLRRLIFEGQTANGINIDDFGTFATPAHHVVLSEITVRNMVASGNSDGIKLSGVQDFVIENATIVKWGTGGSAIDMVGCHRGVIQNSYFSHSDTEGGTGPQMKGGSTNIAIRNNRFEHAGVRAVQIGGLTGLQFFRPQPPANYEARNCIVENNVFIGSEAAVTFVNVDGSTFRYNTIYRPTRWVLRILQENRTAGFVPSRNGVFSNNIVYWRGSDLPMGAANVGSATAPATFTFTRNWWYRVDAPASSKPSLPSAESGGVYGIDPQFVNPGIDLHLRTGSPATTYGAYANLTVTPPPLPPPPPVGTGTGLRGEYFSNLGFTGLVMTRIDPTIDFIWQGGAPTGMDGNTFSVRWTGRVQAAFSETYTFYTQSDDGVRLWVNGVLLINNWTNHANREDRASISLTAGQSYSVRLEYFENTGSAVMRLLWSSPSTAKAVIPTARLSP
jgi:glucose/arabinose dehydrogenase